MARLKNPKKTKLATRIARLRRHALRLERALERETRKRQIPCSCHKSDYILTQTKFEEICTLYEKVMESFRAEHRGKQQAEMLERTDNVAI